MGKRDWFRIFHYHNNLHAQTHIFIYLCMYDCEFDIDFAQRNTL